MIWVGGNKIGYLKSTWNPTVFYLKYSYEIKPFVYERYKVRVAKFWIFNMGMYKAVSPESVFCFS
jgi:hypothetical protein